MNPNYTALDKLWLQDRSRFWKDKWRILSGLILLVGLVFISSPLLLQAQEQAQDIDEQAEISGSHTVQVGETLSAIALRYAITVEELMAYNGITDPDALLIGQVLTLPPGSSLPEATLLPVQEAQADETSPDTEAEGASDSEPDATRSDTAESDTTESDTTESDTTELNARAPETFEEIGGQLDDEFVQSQTATLNRTYTVVAGDTFSRIALRTGVDPDALRRLNRMSRTQTAQLFAGQTLLLPATGDDLRVRRPEREYVVQPGDSLGAIATQFDLTVADLLTTNYLADPNNVVVGQRLTIPEPASVETVLAKRAALVGPEKNGYYYYTVQLGDTISELAQAFNSTKLAIFEYNKDVLPNEETVYTGVEIRIPYGPPTLPNQRPPIPASGSSFLVSLSRQQCWLFHGERVVQEWTCSTGYGDWITRVGTFAVQSKIENAESSAYRLDMPYWLGIYNVGQFENGIHGLPVDWDTGEKIWEGLIGEPATFGCAMLDDRDAAVLFAAAYIGMPIHITN